jgi:hypothetical protein
VSRLAADLQAALDPTVLLRRWGLEPEPWQEELLRERPQRGLMCCCRQTGKSTTAAAAAVHEALYTAGALCLLIAPSQRQSSELLRKVRSLLTIAAPSMILTGDSATEIELANGSRIVSLPGRDDTIRGYSSVRLLAFDEAGWVLDDVYMAALPMLAVSGGRLLALSTPNGQRGWFYTEWESGENWHRTRITASQCPRISAEHLAEMRQTMTAARFASEYDCVFADAVESVFFAADVRAAIDSDLTPLYQGGW